MAGEVAKAFKGMRYLLLKYPARLRPVEARRLATLLRQNRALDRAHQLKEYLATILQQAPAAESPVSLNGWLGWAPRSGPEPFVRGARSIRKHAEGILGCLNTRLINGPVESSNDKLRVIARRAYG